MKLWEKANFVAKYLITQCAIKKAMILNDNVKADLTLRASDHLQSIVQIWPKICTVRNFNSFPVQLRPTFSRLKGKSWHWDELCKCLLFKISMIKKALLVFCKFYSFALKLLWIQWINYRYGEEKIFLAHVRRKKVVKTWHRAREARDIKSNYEFAGAALDI